MVLLWCCVVVLSAVWCCVALQGVVVLVVACLLFALLGVDVVLLLHCV